jgi:GT2 family glycosyltransferase
VSRAFAGPRVLAAIPHFSAPNELLERVLAAVQAQTSVGPIEIVIVANNPRHIPEMLNTPDSRFRQIRPAFNVGYAGALEAALTANDCDFLWVLQEDTIPEPDCLAGLLAEIQSQAGEPTVAMVSPFHITGDGMKPARFRGQVWNLDEGTFVGGLGGEPPTESLVVSDWSMQEAPFLYLSGALMRATALREIGGFDVSFWPKGFVDADTSFRLLKAGYVIMLSKSARISHLARQGSSEHPAGWESLSYFRNQERLFSKYRPSGHAPLADDLGLDAAQMLALASGLAAFIDVLGEQLSAQKDAETPASEEKPSTPPRGKKPDLVRRIGRRVKRMLSST